MIWHFAAYLPAPAESSGKRAINLSTGGSNESIQDGADQAEEAKRPETPRENSQASEEDEGAKREGGRFGRPEKRIPLAVLVT